MAEWTVSAAVLYVLFPALPGVSFAAFAGIFLFTQIFGFLSQVPGGLGVFETGIVTCLSSAVPAPSILASLLAYRLIYYLVPFLMAIFMLGAHEFFEKKEKMKRFAEMFGRFIPALVPQGLALATFIAGLVLLFSGVTPAVPARLVWLEHFLPLPVLEFSHFLGSIAGILLLFLARGIQRRLDAAYSLTLLLLGGGMVFCLLKGFDYEEAIALGLMLLAFLPCRNHFYRRASLFEERFTLEWGGAIILAVLSTLWLGFFAYKHLEFSRELWWQFSFDGNAPRFLRAAVWINVVLLTMGMRHLMRPAMPAPTLPALKELRVIRPIVSTSPRTYANLALLGDKEILIGERVNAFIMYGIRNRSWIALGDPVGPREEWPDLILKFRELCDRYDGWPVFYGAGAQNLPLYVDQGFSFFKIGEEARVSLPGFNMEGSDYKEFRHLLKHQEREGFSFEMLSREQVPAYLNEFQEISDTWLASRNTREKGFSLGFFDDIYLSHFPAAVVRRNGKITAFTNVWFGGEREEISCDLMRYDPEIKNVMDFLFLHLILWGRDQGYRWFNLGMAPLAGLENHAFAPLWSRVGAFLFSHAEQFYNFQGLRQFKEKFNPQWQPTYLASPAGLPLPRILADLVSLISGGIKATLTK